MLFVDRSPSLEHCEMTERERKKETDMLTGKKSVKPTMEKRHLNLSFNSIHHRLGDTKTTPYIAVPRKDLQKCYLDAQQEALHTLGMMKGTSKVRHAWQTCKCEVKLCKSYWVKRNKMRFTLGVGSFLAFMCIYWLNKRIHFLFVWSIQTQTLWRRSIHKAQQSTSCHSNCLPLLSLASILCSCCST